MPAITTNSRWMLMTVIRIPENVSFWVTHINGSPITTTEVPMLSGDYYPHSSGGSERLYEMMTAQLVASVPASNASFSTHGVLGYKCVLDSTSGSTTVDFGDPTSAGKNALGLQSAIRVPTQIITLSSSTQIMARTPKGTALGEDPLVSYKEPEKFVKKNFFTDAGEVQTTFRYKTTPINFSVHTEGRPQASSNEINLYHDMRDVWIEASKGKEVRLYPSYTSIYPYDETDASKLDGYRTIRLLGSVFAPTQTSNKRLHHILEIEAKEI